MDAINLRICMYIGVPTYQPRILRNHLTQLIDWKWRSSVLSSSGTSPPGTLVKAWLVSPWKLRALSSVISSSNPRKPDSEAQRDSPGWPAPGTEFPNRRWRCLAVLTQISKSCEHANETTSRISPARGVWAWMQLWSQRCCFFSAATQQRRG